MRILAISPVFPYPPRDGDRIRIYNFLRHLSKKHRICLVTRFVKGEEELAGKMAGICVKTRMVHLRKAELALNTAGAFFTGTPLTVAAYGGDDMQRAVSEEYETFKPDAVFAYRLRSAPFCARLPAPAVIDIVDSMALLNARRARYEKNPLRLIYGLIDGPRLLKYERSLGENFGAVIVNSEDDAAFLGGGKMHAVANGSDGRCLRKRKNAVFTAGFFGNMEYPPNADAAVFFVKKVWKKQFASDNNMRLVIAGDKKRGLKGLGGGNVEVKGYVDDIDAEISGWDASVVPVRYGAGRQNKILKSWSCGVPVIASVFAAKGVYGRHGANMLIAESESDYAQCIKTLMRGGVSGRIIKGGLTVVRRSFNWEKSSALLEKIIKKAVKGKK